MASSTLMLHRGAVGVPRSQVKVILAPPATKAWFPFPHGQVTNTVEGDPIEQEALAEGADEVSEVYFEKSDGVRFERQAAVLQVAVAEAPERQLLRLHRRLRQDICRGLTVVLHELNDVHTGRQLDVASTAPAITD